MTVIYVNYAILNRNIEPQSKTIKLSAKTKNIESRQSQKKNSEAERKEVFAVDAQEIWDQIRW